MEPRKAELQKTPQRCQVERKRRFQIVKLEERIAPRGNRYYYCNGGGEGWHKHGWSGPPGQVR